MLMKKIVDGRDLVEGRAFPNHAPRQTFGFMPDDKFTEDWCNYFPKTIGVIAQTGKGGPLARANPCKVSDYP